MPVPRSDDTGVDYSRLNTNRQDSEEVSTGSTMRSKLYIVKNPEKSQETEASITTEDLYPDWQTLNPFFSTALRLMREARVHIDQSIKYHSYKELILADNEIQKVQALLSELFCCRSIGDGFGHIVASVMHALQNTQGIPLAENQVIAINRVFFSLHQEPFINFERAIDITDILEDVDLNILPTGLDFLADDLLSLTND